MSALRIAPSSAQALPITLIDASLQPPLAHVETRLPEIRVALPDGAQARLPGTVWPAVALAQTNSGGRGDDGTPLVAVVSGCRARADAFYDRWHDLGACRRPFGRQDFELRVGGELVAAATSCSTVSASVTETLSRTNTVELARLARDDRHPHALRALLRLYRLYLAPTWPYWPAEAVIAYALPGKQGGQLYRFDGWTFIRRCKPWGGGATWSRPSAANAIGDGIKTLWAYPYASVPLCAATEHARRKEDPQLRLAEVEVAA